VLCEGDNIDPHAPVPREAIDGNAMRRKLAPTALTALTASIAELALMISKRPPHDAVQPGSSFQNLLHRAC
jgi:hypothetical protein